MKAKKAVKLARRESTIVSRKRFDVVARRERLNTMLRVHDLEKARRPVVELDEMDWAILRQIAQEGAMTNIGPGARAAAVMYLAKTPSTENLNLLGELANHGEDFYVRSQALIALGTTGLRLAAPILAERLGAEERMERLAAEHGLAALGQRLGVGALRQLLQDDSRHDALQRIEAMISRRSGQVRRKRRSRPTTTTALRRT